MFYRVQNHEVQPSGFRPDKTRSASFLTASKTFLEKRVSIEFITIMLLWELAYEENTAH